VSSPYSFAVWPLRMAVFSLFAPYTPHGNPELGHNGTLSRDMEIQQKEEEKEEDRKKEVDCLISIRTSG